MSHVPRFWREKDFIGWVKFLKKLAEEQPTKVLNSAQLAQFYCPHGVEEQEKVQQNIGNALSMLKTSGILTSNKRGYYKYAYPFPPMPDQQHEEAVVREQEITYSKLPGFKLEPVTPAETVVHVGTLTSTDDPILRDINKINRLSKAIAYALNAGVEVPIKWVEQYNELV